MAPVTPSPHRFLPGQRRQPSPTKSVKPASALRRQIEQRPPERAPSPPQLTTANQFAAAPRFSARNSNGLYSRSLSPSKPTLIDALRTSNRSREDVEDTPLGDGDEEMLDNEQEDALPTIEGYELAEPGPMMDLPLSPKKRRLDGESGDGFSPAKPAFKQPQTPASHVRNAIPRFTHPPSSIASTLEDAPIQQRPAFLRPSVAPSEPSEPVPEAFSPHRRGQKFVPGGMAATVQQWAIETGQAAQQGRSGRAYLRGDDYVFRVKVEVVVGEGPWLVKAKTAEGEDVHVMLATNAAAHSESISRVATGSIAGVRAPTWDIDIQGTTWKVAADWKLL